MSSSGLASTTEQEAHEKPKRKICKGCSFPMSTCVCSSLPSAPLSTLFHRSRIIVLRHPHELRRKNSSLPLVELCMFGKGYEQTTANNDNEVDSSDDRNFVMKTVIGRRFGDHSVMDIFRDPNEVVLLVFPHKQAVGLDEGIRIAEERCGSPDITDNNNVQDSRVINNPKQEEDSNKNTQIKHSDKTRRKKITLVFIDATWKHAREMETRADSAGEWPNNVIRVQMTPSADNEKTVSETDSTKGVPSTFIERRFQIRAPPSPDHMSTAECLAWVASRVEHNPYIYQSITNTLDCMVDIWRRFTTASDSKGKSIGPATTRVRGFTDGDGCMLGGWDSMSQKKRKIPRN